MIDWLPALVKTLATGDGAVLLIVVHMAAISASPAAQRLRVRETRQAIGHATHPGPDVPPLSSLPRLQP